MLLRKRVEEIVDMVDKLVAEFSSTGETIGGRETDAMRQIARVVRGLQFWGVVMRKDSPLAIEDIGHSIGYENVSQFIRIFKRVYGVSPNHRKQVTILINS